MLNLWMWKRFISQLGIYLEGVEWFVYLLEYAPFLLYAWVRTKNKNATFAVNFTNEWLKLTTLSGKHVYFGSWTQNSCTF